MQIDNKSLQKILSMSDAELTKLVGAAASEGGISMPSVSEADLAKLRAALGGISTDPAAIDQILKATNNK